MKRHDITIHTSMDNETSTWESEGQLTYKDNTYVMTYPDYSGNTQTDNKLVIDEKRMHLIRSGAMTSDMVFEESMVTKGIYSVLYYQAPIEVMTSVYKMSETDSLLEINVEYQLFDSGNELANNQMVITITK